MSSERDPLWDGLHELAKQNHRDRVEKNPERIAYAEKRLKAEGIRFAVKNQQTGHIQAWDDTGRLFQFWAGTGKIMGHSARGIESFIKLIRGQRVSNKIKIEKGN